LVREGKTVRGFNLTASTIKFTYEEHAALEAKIIKLLKTSLRSEVAKKFDIKDYK